MDSQFQTSFIPKRPLIDKTPAKPPHARNIGTVIASIILVTVIALAAGVFAYNIYVNKRTDSLKTQLSQVVADLQPNLINNLSRLNDRIVSTNSLLAKHIALSGFFSFLGDTTLVNIRFSSFDYGTNSNSNLLTIKMIGQAKSFSDIALQAEKFADPQYAAYIKSPVFSNLGLDKSGNVTFSFSASIDPSTYLYSKTLSGSAAPTNTATDNSQVKILDSTQTGTSTVTNTYSATQ